MAIVFDAPLSPDAQTAYIREVPISRGNPLLGQVPITTQYDQFFEWSEITRKNQTAEYRSFDGRIKVTERDSLAGKRVPLAPFSDSLNLGEYERLQIEFMRTGGTRDAALVDAIYRDTDKLVSNMHNRMELALGDVLSDGIFTVTGESGEFSGEADFGVPAAHKVTAGTVWTTTSAPVLDNLQAWVDLYVEANGVPPGADHLRVEHGVPGPVQEHAADQRGRRRCRAAHDHHRRRAPRRVRLARPADEDERLRAAGGAQGRERAPDRRRQGDPGASRPG